MMRTGRLISKAGSAAAALPLAALVACSHSPPGNPAADVDEMIQRGDTAQAVHYLEHVDKDQQPVPELHILLGSLYRDRNDIQGRLRSQYVLERARQLFPDDPDVLIALGKTYYAQDFLPDAERCFKSALKIDAGRCDARYYLGRYYYDRWRRVSEHRDELMRARSHLKIVTACDTTNLDAALKYLYSLYVLDRIDDAEIQCERFLNRFPQCGEIYLLRGTIAYDDERYDEAHRDYTTGLEMLDEESRAIYGEMRFVFSFPQNDALDAAAFDDRAVISRGYWIHLDPDPTTEINERHLEHMHRVFIADINYSIARPETRGWDTERGETFIKFGRPLDIHSTLGGSWKDGRQETWSYMIDGYFQTFRFVDERLNGDMKIPFIDDVKLSFLRHSTRNPTFFSDAIPIPGDMDVIAFRDNDFTSSIYIALRVDADSVHSVVDMSRVNYFELRGAFFDDEWMVDKRFAETLWASSVPTGMRSGRNAYELVRSVQMPFDYYHFTCTFADEYEITRAQFRADGETYRYAGDDLTVSDILLQSPDGTGTPIERRGFTLYPHPGHVYHQGERLTVYFEVYGLSVIRQSSDYQVSFSIYEAPDEPAPTWLRWSRRIGQAVGIGDEEPTISQTIERAGPDHEAQEEIRINVDSLREGRYQLVIDVFDRVSGDTSEAITVVFEKVGTLVRASR